MSGKAEIRGEIGASRLGLRQAACLEIEIPRSPSIEHSYSELANVPPGQEEKHRHLAISGRPFRGELPSPHRNTVATTRAVADEAVFFRPRDPT